MLYYAHNYTLKCIDCGVPVGTTKERMVPVRCTACKTNHAARWALARSRRQLWGTHDQVQRMWPRLVQQR